MSPSKFGWLGSNLNRASRCSPYIRPLSLHTADGPKGEASPIQLGISMVEGAADGKSELVFYCPFDFGLSLLDGFLSQTSLVCPEARTRGFCVSSHALSHLNHADPMWHKHVGNYDVFSICWRVGIFCVSFYRTKTIAGKHSLHQQFWTSPIITVIDQVGNMFYLNLIVFNQLLHFKVILTLTCIEMITLTNRKLRFFFFSRINKIKS